MKSALRALRPERIHPLFWLALAGLVCYGGPAILRLGLYHDDWPTLEHMVFAPNGFWPALLALARGEPKLLLRPLSVPIFAGLYAMFGLRPLGWHLVSLAANVWIAWGLVRLARRYGVASAPALAGALLFLGYPNKDATYFWCIVGLNAYSFLFLVEALVAHADFVATGRRGRFALSMGCLAVCLASYDQSLLMAPVWLLSPGWKGRRPPVRAWTGFFAAAAVSAVYIGYKFGLAPSFASEPRQIGWSFARIPEVLLGGASSQLGGNMWEAAFQAMKDGFRYSPWVAAAGLLLPWAALSGREEKGAGVDRGLFVLAAALLFLSYAVFIPSFYRMNPITHFNRFNNIGAFAMSLAAAGAASIGFKRRASWAVGGLAGLFLAAHSGFALYWVVSAELQEKVRRILISNHEAWAPERALLVRPDAHMVGGRAPVFIESWDIGGAAHIWTGERGRRAYVIRPGVAVGKDGVDILGEHVPYSRLTLLDSRYGTVVDADRASLEALLR